MRSASTVVVYGTTEHVVLISYLKWECGAQCLPLHLPRDVGMILSQTVFERTMAVGFHVSDAVAAATAESGPRQARKRSWRRILLSARA